MEAVRQALADGSHQVEFCPTQAPGHATEIASRKSAAGADLIIAAGGDGTVNEVMNGMVGSQSALGILPFGTANVLASEMGLGRKMAQAAARIGEWEPVRVGAGLAANLDGSRRRHFLLMAGIGLDAHVVANINLKLKNRLGKGAYWLAGFQTLRRRLPELEIHNGPSRRCSFALLSRVRNYGGDLEIARRASLLAPDFDVVLFEGSNPFYYLKYLAGVASGSLARMSGVTLARTTSAELLPVNGTPVHLQVDGEPCGTLPARIQFVADAITLLMPREFLAQERSRWKI